MYKLVIADDEKIIRQGLKNMIDWNELGFEVIDLFSDGQEIIESLDSITPDVILTDIKMVHASGLDVAKYIFDNKLPSKVVLISGYQEFDLAIAGMKYGVTDYLLKPINVDEITNTFSKLKATLDSEKSSKERMEETNLLLAEHFFTDLILGGVADNKEYIHNRFHVLYPNIDPEICSCFLADIHILNYEKFLSQVWNYSQDQLEENLANFLKIYNKDYIFHIVYKTGAMFELVGIYVGNHKRESDTEILEKLARSLQENFLFTLNYEILHHYDSIYSLGSPSLPAMASEKATTEATVNRRIDEQKKLMISNIFIGNL